MHASVSTTRSRGQRDDRQRLFGFAARGQADRLCLSLGRAGEGAHSSRTQREHEHTANMSPGYAGTERIPRSLRCGLTRLAPSLCVVGQATMRPMSK